MSDIYVSVHPEAAFDKWLDRATSLFMFGFTIFNGWQVMKALNPGLQIKEDEVLRKIKAKYKKPSKDVTQREEDELIAEVTSYLRDHSYDFRLDKDRNVIPFSATTPDLMIGK
jgi:hypothetical protein